MPALSSRFQTEALKGNDMTNIIKKNSQGFNYKYADLAETHRYLDESGQRYYQEIEVVDGHDYITTICLDELGKELRRCRGCRIPAITGKGNLAQEAGSAITYARRYSLWMAFGLATADDDAATLDPVEPKVVRRKKSMERPKADTPKATPRAMGAKTMRSMDKPYRQAGVQAVKDLLDSGALELSEVQSEVRKYGADKMLDLSPDAFVRCVANLTMGRGGSA